jgi:hypothetical protein
MKASRICAGHQDMAHPAIFRSFWQILTLWIAARYVNLFCVHRLTRQEQLVLCIVLGLLLTGWAVKTYRTAHPPVAGTETVRP